MPRPSKDKLVPYVDDRPDLDQRFAPLDAPTSVSYTHLTLPTILLV